MFKDFSVVESLFPSKCRLCQQKTHAGQWCCNSCSQTLPFIKHRCPVCAVSMPSSSLCGQCLNNRRYFDESVSVFELHEPIKTYIYKFKYKHDFSFGRILADELLKEITASCKTLPQLIVPVPLHRKRLFTRGFNQSALLSSFIAKRMNIPHKSRYLVRHRYAEPQIHLDAKQRYLSVKDAFEVNNKQRFDHIAVVDDVVTTANTVNQAAKALKNVGINKVSIWSIARNT